VSCPRSGRLRSNPRGPWASNEMNAATAAIATWLERVRAVREGFEGSEGFEESDRFGGFELTACRRAARDPCHASRAASACSVIVLTIL